MIGKKLKSLIESQNIRQSQFAEVLGISPSRLSNYLASKREPDLEMLAKMATFLKTDLNFFADVRFADGVVCAETHTPETALTEPEQEIVYIEVRMVNSKRWSGALTKLAFSKSMLQGLNVEKLSIYEAHADIADVAKQGDYLIVEPFTQKSANNGSLMIYRGRNHRLARLFIKDGKRMLVHSDTNTLENANDIKGYDIIRMVISRL